MTDPSVHTCGNCSPSVPRAVVWLMVGAAAIFVISLSVRLISSCQNYGDLDHNAPGTWVAMAVDARHGLFYRDIVSPIGYGGTRYAPVMVVLYAGLLGLGLNAFTSGFILGLGATALVVAGLFVLMRQLKTPIGVAAPLALFVLAASCFRVNILGIRGDILPLGLSLWGLIAVVWFSDSPNVERRRLGLLAAAMIFALAAATKITSVYGIATAAIWLVSRRQIRDAALLCAGWGIIMICFVVLTQWASDGRAVAIFRLCATGSGGLTQVLHGPHDLLVDAKDHDHVFLALWLLAVALFVINRQWTSLPGIFWALTTIGTAVVYGSPGTKFNHLADMTAASILVIAMQCRQSRFLASASLMATVALVLLASAVCWREAGAIRHEKVRDAMETVLADANASSIQGPMLSEDPLLPILAGERPYMIDSFMFRTVRHKRPWIADKLWNDLADHHFRAVILHEAPTSDIYSDHNDGDFGPGFIDRVEANYVLSSVRGHFYIFLPKQ